MAVAVSGGPDSLALLYTTWQQAQPLGLQVWALHVHHGLQAVADAWPAHIQAECRRWRTRWPQHQAIEFRATRLKGRPSKGQSVEEWAREARRQALIDMAHSAGLDLVLLAQHRGDQAETFLLQALRGAGPQGLAAMGPQQVFQGVCLARPWLSHPRSSVLEVVKTAGLIPVQDPSNEDIRWARNRLRLEVMPSLTRAFPQAEAMLAEAARQSARALPTLSRGAQADGAASTRGGLQSPELELDRGVWKAMGDERRAAVLRAWLAEQGVRRPSAALIERVARESVVPSTARWPAPGGGEVRLYRERLQWVASAPLVPSARDVLSERSKHTGAPTAQVLFNRAGIRRLEAWGGRLQLRRARPGEPGLCGPLPVVCMVRARRGDDRFQRAPRTPPRQLKKQFQALGVAPWLRHAPLVCDPQGRVLLVPGLGMDARVTADLAEPRNGRRTLWVLEWLPDGPTE